MNHKRFALIDTYASPNELLRRLTADGDPGVGGAKEKVAEKLLRHPSDFYRQDV